MNLLTNQLELVSSRERCRIAKLLLACLLVSSRRLYSRERVVQEVSAHSVPVHPGYVVVEVVEDLLKTPCLRLNSTGRSYC